MKKSKVSYVIPLYNKEAYIAECLEALKKQTVGDIEIIVVDDKSTDDSLAIAKFIEKTDSRIKVVELNKNVGRSQARNIGNSLAKSDIIAVQDADDISKNNRTEEIIKAFKKKIDVFYSSFLYGDYIVPATEISMVELKNDLTTGIGHSTMAYRKSLVKKYPYSLGEWSDLGLDDWKLQIDLITNNIKFDFSTEALVLYRMTSNSISANRDAVAVNKLKREYLKNEGIISADEYQRCGVLENVPVLS